MIEHLPVHEDFPPEKGQNKIVLWIKNKIYTPISKRVNWTLDLFTDTGDDTAPGFGPVSFVQLDIDYEDGQSEGRLQWNKEDGVPEVGLPGGSVNMQIGNEMPFRVTNDEGSVINNGRAVLVNGATGNRLTVRLPDLSSQADTFAVIGLATEDLSDPGTGYVNTIGFVRGSDDQPVDTSGFAEGGQVFLGDQGVFLDAPPDPPNRTVFVGIVKKVSATVGEIWVNIIHLPMVHELSDVLVTSISDQDRLVWNNADSRWENEKIADGSMYNHDTPTTVTIGAISTPTRVPSGFTAGQNFNTTFQNSREILIGVAGKYQIVWQISFTSASANQEIEGFPMLNNAINIQGTAHRRIATATDTGSMSGTCILDIAANDVIALGVQNETSTANVIVEHANLTLVKVRR